MSVKSGQSVTVMFTTNNPATGAATSATGTPTGLIYVNGTVNGATVTVTNITTGVYKAAVTLPSLSAGDMVAMRISATVSGVAGEGVVWQDVADTKRVSDLNDVSTAQVNAECDTAIADAALATASALSTVAGNVSAILDDTGTSGVVVASMAANSVTASAVAADAVAEIQSGLATSAALATVDTVVDAIKVVTDALPDGGALTTLLSNVAAILTDTGTTLPAQISGLNDPTAAAIAAAVLAETVEGSLDLGEVLRLLLAFAAGISTGGGTGTVVFKDQANSKARITLTVDSNGNRSVTVVDGT